MKRTLLFGLAGAIMALLLASVAMPALAQRVGDAADPWDAMHQACLSGNGGMMGGGGMTGGGGMMGNGGMMGGGGMMGNGGMTGGGGMMGNGGMMGGGGMMGNGGMMGRRS